LHFIDGEKTMLDFTGGATLERAVRRENNSHDRGKSLMQPCETNGSVNSIVNKCGGEVVMTKLANTIAQQWQTRLAQECPAQSAATRTSVVRWLMGADLDRFDRFTPAQLEIVTQGLEYLYRVLSQRYLGVAPTKAYKNLMQRLGGVALVRQKIQSWVAASRDRQRTVVDVLQEVVQEINHRDKYIQQQIAWIGECTKNPHLRSTLLLATIEEYCLRPIRNQPLIAYRFVNYLQRTQRGGVTNLPPGSFVKMVSDVVGDDDEHSVNLIDHLLLEDDLEQQDWEETQILRAEVKERVSLYVHEKLGADASEWLRLYLLGKTPEEMVESLQLDLKQIYRLREKVTYHARVFAMKNQAQVVGEWLKTSLQEHNLGLTTLQWTTLEQSLTPKQLDILNRIKAEESIDTIAKALNLKTNQVEGEWKQVYVIAQNLRTSAIEAAQLTT
jgi:DNA-binding CsgD family transcriptional regulator